MKKIAAILVSLVYIAAIVVVAFIGVLAEIKNETVDVESIVLVQARDLPRGEVLTYPSGTDVLDSDYAIFSRPGEDGKGQTDFVINWSMGGIDYDYVLQIRGYQKIMESPSWKDGAGNLSLAAFVLPENATKQELAYSVLESGGTISSDITADNDGLIHFAKKRTGIFDFDVRISSTDNSYTVCNIHVIAVGY